MGKKHILVKIVFHFVLFWGLYVRERWLNFMQFVLLFSPSFTTELFLKAKETNHLFFFFLFLVSFSKLSTYIVYLYCCLPMENHDVPFIPALALRSCFFSVKYVTGNTIVFINKDLFLEEMHDWWLCGEMWMDLHCHVVKHILLKRVWVISSLLLLRQMAEA